MKKTLHAVIVGLALLPLVAGPAIAAWPLTRRTTYVANTAPAIKAADLNAMQDVVGDMLEGDYSYKGLVIDGTGGAAATPVAGSIKVSRTIVGATVPTATAAAGELTKSMVPICWAHVDSAAGLQQGANVAGLARLALGVYSITCERTPADPTKTTVIATVDSANPRVITAVPYSDGGKAAATVRVWDLGSVAKDEYFSVIFYGE